MEQNKLVYRSDFFKIGMIVDMLCLYKCVNNVYPGNENVEFETKLLICRRIVSDFNLCFSIKLSDNKYIS